VNFYCLLVKFTIRLIFFVRPPYKNNASKWVT